MLQGDLNLNFDDISGVAEDPYYSEQNFSDSRDEDKKTRIFK